MQAPVACEQPSAQFVEMLVAPRRKLFAPILKHRVDQRAVHALTGQRGRKPRDLKSEHRVEPARNDGQGLRCRHAIKNKNVSWHYFHRETATTYASRRAGSALSTSGVRRLAQCF